MKNSTSDLEISEIYRMALKDLGYDNIQIIFSDPKNSPQLLDEDGNPKTGNHIFILMIDIKNMYKMTVMN